jgi:hypothetical protein
MPRKVVRTLSVAVPMVVASLMATASPAQAATGGGCTDHPGSAPCISYSNQYVHSDFYQNRRPDASMRKAALMIYVNGKHVKTKWYDPLTRTGRHGPIDFGVATMPPSRGSAYTKVRVYTSSGALHYEVNSPTVYYP